MAIAITLLNDHLGQKRPKLVTHESVVDALALISVYEIDVAATATIVGVDTLAGASGTSFILTNADGTDVTFTTDPTLNFGDVTADIGDHTWRVNTGGSFSSAGIRKATQAFWIACKGAIDAGELDMAILPTSFSGTETSFTLTQSTVGTVGNTAITLVTGITANGETAFTLGADADVINASDLGMSNITAATITGNSQAATHTANIECADSGSYVLGVTSANSIKIHLIPNSATDDIEVADGASITNTTVRIRAWGAAKL